jgi:hypothetical protein
MGAGLHMHMHMPVHHPGVLCGYSYNEISFSPQTQRAQR